MPALPAPRRIPSEEEREPRRRHRHTFCAALTYALGVVRPIAPRPRPSEENRSLCVTVNVLQQQQQGDGRDTREGGSSGVPVTLPIAWPGISQVPVKQQISFTTA
jgi:hypothetical protein